MHLPLRTRSLDDRYKFTVAGDKGGGKRMNHLDFCVANPPVQGLLDKQMGSW